MNRHLPSVSIIIPVFNGEAFLAEALESVLKQSPPVAEVVVVDDGSTDGTPNLARNGGSMVRYVRQANSGPSAARNRGIRMASGEIIGFLDADDLWGEGQIARQAELLMKHPDVDVVKGMTVFMRKSELPDGSQAYRPYDDPMLYPNLCGTLYRREVFDRVGLLNEELRFGEDVDWTVRARERGAKTYVYDQVTQYHRRHEGNMTRGRNFKQLGGFDVIRLALERRRTSSATGNEDRDPSADSR